MGNIEPTFEAGQVQICFFVVSEQQGEYRRLQPQYENYPIAAADGSQGSVEKIEIISNITSNIQH